MKPELAAEEPKENFEGSGSAAESAEAKESAHARTRRRSGRGMCGAKRNHGAMQV